MTRARFPARALSAAFALGGWLALPAAAQDKPCGECRSDGQLDFEVPKAVVEMEKDCTRCSEVADNAAVNFGLTYKPCPKCQSPGLAAAVRKRWDDEVGRGRAWLAARREVDEYLADKQLKLMHVSTAHFELVWAIQKVKVGRIVLDQHESMHLYARYLEEDYQAWLDTFGFKHVSDQNGVRHTVMVFEQAKHAQKAQPKYCGMGGTGATDGVKLLGHKSVFVTFWNKTKNRDDDEFHEYLLHNVTHHFVTSYYNYFWLARQNGWIDEGLAHYFTDRRFRQCRTHCFQEQDEATNWVHGDWRPEVRKRVLAGKIPVFSDTVVKHGENLTAEEHLFVWSWVQYLVDAHPKPKFVKLLRGLKDKVPLRDLLKDQYGMSPFEFLEQWKKHVIETYPPR